MKEKKPHLYTYCYYWKIDGSNNINYKYITDTLEGIKQFEDNLLKLEGINVDEIVVSYICEYDCSQIGLCYNLNDKRGIKNEA